MGHVVVEAALLSPVTGERVVVEALIDTGATFTTLPRAVADRLKLIEVTRRRVRTASGEEVLPESYVTIEVEGERTTTPILVSEKVDRVLLGALTLEALAFRVDPKTGKLERTELLLL